MRTPPPPRWNWDHSPEVKPLGCNGKYGPSGSSRHYRKGRPACQKCKKSMNHYQREKWRGQRMGKPELYPCGTYAAFTRHKRKGEEPCFPCKVAKAAYSTAHSKPRKKKRLKPCGTPAAYERHRRNREEPCALCRAANSAYKVANKQKKNNLKVA